MTAEPVATEREIVVDDGEYKHRVLPTWLRAITLILFLAGLTTSVLQIFLVVSLFTNFYLYILLAIFLSSAFLFYRASSTSTSNKIPFYDILLALISFACFSYLTATALEISNNGWAFGAPFHYTLLCWVLVPITLEAVRRVAGNVLFFFCAFFAAYPLFADYMPGILSGASFPVDAVLNYHILSTDSVLGLPLQVVGTLVIGYLVFGVVMAYTGGGKFFLDIAFALFGSRAGGPAKVSVISSGLFGSLSGSVVSNVLTTGAFTIPTMKKTGYPPHYAAAVEACASTGGCLAPPVMGAVAFVMATILQIPYWDVVKAATIPALLYYWALFMQVHCYACRNGLRGMSRSQLPRLGPVMKQGWPYLLAFAVMVYLIYWQREGQAPFIASLVLLVVSIIKGDTRLSFTDLARLLMNTGLLIVEVTVVLVACGYILGSFAMTGVGSSFAREIVQLAGDVPFMLLVCGALASYILGMGMTVTASYIFLAAILAPALVNVGFSLIAAHMFVLYWGLSSFITPPVAIGTYVAAGVAGANPIKAGLTGMRMGMVLYVVPFAFIYEPALVLDAPLSEVPPIFVTALIGVALVAGGMEGYAPWFGRLAFAERILLVVAGGSLFWPGLMTDMLGVAIVATLIVYRMLWPPADSDLADQPSLQDGQGGGAGAPRYSLS